MGVCQTCNQFYNRLRTGTQCNGCFNKAYPSVRSRGTTSNGTDADAAVATATDDIQIDGSKPVNELNVDELVTLITRTIQPVKDDLALIRQELSEKTKAHNNRLKLLEADVQQKQERIDGLESTVIEMQKFINTIDHEERRTNIIVTGLSESTIQAPDEDESGTALDNDNEKMKVIIDAIKGNERFDVDTWTISRIGRARDGSNRAIKIVTTSPDERDKVLSLASKLKTQPETWSKVYLKKDLHPVYAKENQRMRKKKYDLTQQFINNGEQHEVKIVKGQLQVDGNTVDRNLFFR